MSEATRRAVLTGAAGISAAAALAACGEDAPEDNGTDAGGDTGAEPTATGGAAGALASVADIPVGGGKVFSQQKVVVTQPSAGEIKAFSAECTHQGCTLNGVEDGLIKCPCHASQFKIADGSVVGGPATKPLAPVTVKVDNGSITLG